MRIINVTPKMDALLLGKQGENKSTKFLFDVSGWLEDYPGCSIGLNYRPAKSNVSYPCILMDENYGKKSWLITSSELVNDGDGLAELVCILDEVVEKDKRTWKTKVMKSLGGGGTAPDPWENWEDTFIELAERAEEAAEDAEDNAEDAEAYAVGTRGGTDVSSDDPAYHNNSKYYSEEAGSSASAAAGSATTAGNKAQDAEAYGVGKRGGVDVESTDPAYHNNAKYFSEQASGSATAAAGSATAAAASAAQAGSKANRSAIAKEYADMTYPVTKGTWCWQEGVLYEANQTISSSETWTAAHWTAVTVEGACDSLKTEINSKADEPIGTKSEGKVYGLDSNLDPVWVTPSGGGDIDDTAGTGVTNKAWSANKLTSEFSAIKDQIAESVIQFENGKTIGTNGTTVDVNTKYDSSTMRSAVINVEEGDVFTINGTGGNSARLWCFIDSSNHVLSVAPASQTESNMVLLAPTNAAKLIVQTQMTDLDSYVGKYVVDRVGEAEDEIVSLKNYVFEKVPFKNGITLDVTGSSVNFINNLYASQSMKFAFIDLTDVEYIIIDGVGGNNSRLWSFIDANNNVLSRSDAYAIEVKEKHTIPANAVKCIIQTKIDHGEAFVFRQAEVKSDNVFDFYGSEYKKDKYRDASGIEQTSSGNGYFAGNMEVRPETNYIIFGIRAAGYKIRIYFLDSNGDWIDRTDAFDPYDGLIFKTPADCHYIQVNGKIFLQLDGESKILRLEEEKHPVFLDVVSDYFSDDLPSYSSKNTTGGVSEVYEAFDGLVEDFPEYVSKTVLGRDQSDTFDIVEYRFKPETVGYVSEHFGSGYVETKNEVYLPLIMVMGSIHGAEKLGTLVLKDFFTKLCNSWTDHNTLTFYRWNVEFRVIPIANPWGYNANVRENSEGLDINRQAKRSESDLATDCAEGLIIKRWINKYGTDAFAFLDLHTQWAGKDRDIAWLLSPYEHLDLTLNSVITKLSRIWKSNYSFITYTGLMGFVGPSTYVEPARQGNQFRYYAYNSKGCENAITLEIAEKVDYNSETKFGQLTTNMYMDILMNLLAALAQLKGASYVLTDQT